MAHQDLPRWVQPERATRPLRTPRLLLRWAHADEGRGAGATTTPVEVTVETAGEPADQGLQQQVGVILLGPVDPRTHATTLHVTIDPPHRQRGLGTEAVAHLLSRLLASADEGGWGLRRVAGTGAASDAGGVGLARHLRLRREVRARQDRWTDGIGLDDTLGWGVLAEEWDAGRHRLRRDDRPAAVGVGPHPRPWPDDPRLDARLLAEGDRRNVADRYRYWSVESIAEDLRRRSHPFHVAIENWRHDLNIGTVVRNANAFGARAVHVVGRRQWNRRGAMVTDRYLDVRHHDDLAGLLAWAAGEGIPIVGVDNVPGSRSILATDLPRTCVLLFGQEGPGLSEAARQAAAVVVHIPQSGSTRSINAGVASGVAMTRWLALNG